MMFLRVDKGSLRKQAAFCVLEDFPAIVEERTPCAQMREFGLCQGGIKYGQHRSEYFKMS